MMIADEVWMIEKPDGTLAVSRAGYPKAFEKKANATAMARKGLDKVIKVTVARI